MMACLNEKTLQAYFDGELASAATAQVIKHLAECDACAAKAFEVERAIELMASAFEDELPDSIPSERLRARIDAALAGDSITAERVRPSRWFWPRILGAPIAAFKLWALSPRRLAYATLAILALVCAFWFARTGFFSQDGVDQVQTPGPAPTAGDQQQPNVAGGSSGHDETNKSTPGTEGREPQLSKSQRSPRPPAPRRYANAKQEAPITPLANQRHDLEWVAETGGASLQIEPGVFDAGMIRHFEKAQILLRSFRNSDTSAKGFDSELAYERRQSKSLLYKNILLRRDAETSGNLPAEEVLGSLEPVLLDIANLPDHPSPDDVRSIKERIHKREIIGVLQVYSAPSMVAGYQP